MIDIERLHRVHAGGTRRRAGKTTYMFDSILRTTQLGQQNHVYCVFNDTQTAMDSLHHFIEFLHNEGEEYERRGRGNIELNGTDVRFVSKAKDLTGRRGIVFKDLH